MSEIALEFERLHSVFERLGIPLASSPPATDQQISSVYAETGIEPCPELKEIWHFSNGSNGAMWFAEGEDEFTPYCLLSTDEVVKSWKTLEPYDADFYERWVDHEDDGSIRGPKIQPRIVRHSKWLSFAEFNGGSHLLQFDFDPTPSGSEGQIINFIHDPDGVNWIAGSFLEFFTASNDILIEWLEYPEDLKRQLWIWD